MLYLDDFSFMICYDKIMKLEPESVLDIGCGCGFTLWRLQQKLAFDRTKGIESDVGKCMRRVARNIVQCDLVKFPWPVADYDLAFSFFTLDKITDDFVPAFAEEIKKHSKRGLHFIGNDNLSKWKDLLPNHEFITFDEYVKTQAINEYNKGVKKINFGCGRRMYLHGWINIDNQIPNTKNYVFVAHDVRYKLFECPENLITAITSHHLLNYLEIDETRLFLDECWRASTVGSFIRISIPDPEKLDNMPDDIYSSGPNEVSNWREGVKKVYNQQEVIQLLNDAGFAQAQKAEFGKSISQTIQSETYDCYPQFSQFIEARKLVL